MFEVFAGFCFYGASMIMQCEDYVIDSYDDQLSCEIATNYYRRDNGFIQPACIPSPEVEPMPDGEKVSDPVAAVTSFFVDNLDAAALVQMYAAQEKTQ